MPPVISLTLDGITLFSRIRYVVKQAIACDTVKRVCESLFNNGEYGVGGGRGGGDSEGNK